MALKLISFFTFSIALIVVVAAKEELVVVHAPDSVTLTSLEPLRSGQLADLFSAALGFTTPSQNQLPLAPVNPLKRPEAILHFDFRGFDDLELPLNYPADRLLLENEGDVEDQLDRLVYRAGLRYPGSQLVTVQLPGGASSDIFSAEDSPLSQDPVLSDTRLNASLQPDQSFLEELSSLRSILPKLEKAGPGLRGGAPELLLLRSGALTGLVEAYGASSPQVVEALRLIQLTLTQAAEVARQVYGDDVLVTATTQQGISGIVRRHARSVMGYAEEKKNNTDHNVAYEWREGFHAAFMTVTFVTVSLILAVAGVILGLMTSDMGRDPIIYRATGVRIKRD